MALHKTKYEQVILYLCWKLGKEIRGKKKLAKLLYYIDFDYYEKYQKYFTGEIYKKLPMGPFPISLEKIIDEMERKKILSIEKIEEWEVATAYKNPTISTEIG